MRANDPTYGTIIVHRTSNPLGVESETFEWKGGPKVLVDHRIVGSAARGFNFSEGDSFNIGPYCLRIIEIRFESLMIDCIRLDYPLWWWFVFSHHAFRWLRIAKARFVITLAVWGLADYHPSRIPSFSDIHAVRWLAGLFHRSKP